MFRTRHRTLRTLALAALLGAALPPASEAAIEGINWFPIGPGPGSFGTVFPGGVGGRASAVAANPFNPSDVWVGTAQGGVWHSTDGGASWRPVSDNEASLAIGSLALAGCAPNGCSTIYAGTGENAIRRDTFYGKGLLLGNVDGPDVFWDQKTGSPYEFRLGAIYNVVLDPTTSGSTQVIYITLSSGTTASATESTVTAPEPSPGGYAIYKSTNNGNTWTKLGVSGADGHRPTDLEMDPTDPMTLYAGFLGRGVFKSEDGGTTWCPRNKGIPKPMGCPNLDANLPNLNSTEFDHVEIALAPSDPNILYASFGMCPGVAGQLRVSCSPSVFKSIDAGISWTEMYAGTTVPTTACTDAYSRYTHALAVDPIVPETVLLGAVRLCRSTNSGAIWSLTDQSTLGGGSVGMGTHFDHRAVVFHPADPNWVYDVNDGGIAVSSDGGHMWTPRNGKMQTIGFQSIASSPLTARVIGGTQDNSGQMWTGLSGWEFLPCCGDGGFSVMDLDSKMIMYVTTNSSTTTNNTSAHPKRSSDFGASFNDAVNTNLDPEDPRSFYPPLVQDPTAPHPLYFGTNRLYRSANDAASWTVVSPVLSSVPQTEILAEQDVITAIAVAPGDPDRIYLGYYSGKVFVTDGACTSTSCWPERDSGLPGGPVTWIAVHPGDPNTAYATLGGFFPGVHVYKTTNGGVSWSATGAHADLNGVPAKTIAVEPGAPSRLWLGTDVGVYKSHNSGLSWFRHSNGLPNVPVFEISIDASRGRVYAGTHGRGAYILTSPFLSNYEGWMNDQIWDIPVYGNGFLPNQNCTMKVLRQNLSVCAQGGTDAIGGTIQTDNNGVLVTSQGGVWNNTPVAWACLNGNCLGGGTIASCNQPGNQVAAVIAICGPQIGVDLLTGCPPLTNPPSSWTSLTGQGGFNLEGMKQGPLRSLASGQFSLIPTLQTGDGSTESLCSVDVPFTSTETQKEILEKARDLINADPVCLGKGVSAGLIPGRPSFEVEDLFPDQDNLNLSAPGLSGGQLIPALRAAPGQTTGVCFRMSKLGVPVVNQVRIMRARFETASGGASGGAVVVRERTGLGLCSIKVPTMAGDSAETIAKAVQDAFQAPGIPGPHPVCPSDRNPRDISRVGDGFVTVLPAEVEICMEDPGVGFSYAPAETCFSDADCGDGNPCTRDRCDPQSRQCVISPEPDGTPCEDGNLCTTGGTCQAGVCGAPVQCHDGSLCTEDLCDPATGRCFHPPVACDDGNVCTRDSCAGTTGECLFEALTGLQCDDGALCTVGDVCAADPSGAVVCRGTPACNDGNLCSEDRCDPLTGGCSNPPVDCDDGNSCTEDTCSEGACLARYVFNVPCDDGSLCTIDDICRPAGAAVSVCTGSSPGCDDGNVCTADVCDEATGSCVSAASALSPVEDLHFAAETQMTWQPPSAAGHSNTYRGRIPATLMSSKRLVYDHVCFESADANGDGAEVATDAEIPPIGTAFYYATSHETGCGESAPCFDDDGTPCPIPQPCPTPP
ncbi:MAG TPA: hypothetical protein VJV23_05255 [Candidatus Polarisedimenticolia bacterium]|nr:hypothetical protein [Candidatus Polarisedimenticolia bacterium]